MQVKTGDLNLEVSKYERVGDYEKLRIAILRICSCQYGGLNWWGWLFMSYYKNLSFSISTFLLVAGKGLSTYPDIFLLMCRAPTREIRSEYYVCVHKLL